MGPHDAEEPLAPGALSFGRIQACFGLLRDEAPFGISKTYCLFALAKQAKTLRANKLARFALEKLSQCKVPTSWQEQVDVFALSVRR